MIYREVSYWHLTDVHADPYFGRYRDKNEHTASTREPTRLTQLRHWPAWPHDDVDLDESHCHLFRALERPGSRIRRSPYCRRMQSL
jgi:hypothetical protein